MAHPTRREAVRLLASTAACAAPAILRRRYRVLGNATEYSARCVELLESSIVVDMLSPLTLGPEWTRWADQPSRFTDRDFARYRSSGINVFHQAVGIGEPDAPGQVRDYLVVYDRLLTGADRHFLRIERAGDFQRAKASGTVGLVLGVQNSEHFVRVEDVSRWHGLGQRVSQLTYNARNRIGSGCAELLDGGITEFGAAVVGEMNRVGMAVDVSHCGDRTTLDAAALSKRPVLVTHSNCRALNPRSARCKTDQAIRAIARSGGVFGMTGVRYFVKGEEPTTMEDVLDHFDHARRLIGAEHLGVGSDIDLDGYDALPEDYRRRLLARTRSDGRPERPRLDVEGLDHPRRMFDLTEGFIRRRYSDREIRGILGGNFVRALSEIWDRPT